VLAICGDGERRDAPLRWKEGSRGHQREERLREYTWRYRSRDCGVEGCRCPDKGVVEPWASWSRVAEIGRRQYATRLRKARYAFSADALFSDGRRPRCRPRRAQQPSRGLRDAISARPAGANAPFERHRAFRTAYSRFSPARILVTHRAERGLGKKRTDGFGAAPDQRLVLGSANASSRRVGKELVVVGSVSRSSRTGPCVRREPFPCSAAQQHSLCAFGRRDMAGQRPTLAPPGPTRARVRARPLEPETCPPCYVDATPCRPSSSRLFANGELQWTCQSPDPIWWRTARLDSVGW